MYAVLPCLFNKKLIVVEGLRNLNSLDLTVKYSVLIYFVHSFVVLCN